MLLDKHVNFGQTASWLRDHKIDKIVIFGTSVTSNNVHVRVWSTNYSVKPVLKYLNYVSRIVLTALMIWLRMIDMKVE